eukprot:Amastigsp_a519338_6.p4 type:complete len:143 gc:universal Amastigsp_a519338_6:504-76(-)
MGCTRRRRRGHCQVHPPRVGAHRHQMWSQGQAPQRHDRRAEPCYDGALAVAALCARAPGRPQPGRDNRLQGSRRGCACRRHPADLCCRRRRRHVLRRLHIQPAKGRRRHRQRALDPRPVSVCRRSAAPWRDRGPLVHLDSNR